MDSQLPPPDVETMVLKPREGVPVLDTEMICGSGLAPPNVLVKLMALIWLGTLVPTTTLMGMVTLLPFDWKTTSPTNVPATSACPGSLAGTMLTVTSDGAVPLAAETWS